MTGASDKAIKAARGGWTEGKNRRLIRRSVF